MASLSTTSIKPVETATHNSTGYFNVSGILYDKNGNIKNLNRTGAVVTEFNMEDMDSNFGAMDELSYAYEGNQLQSVTDGAHAAFGFKGSSAAYTYDVNGNMLTDSGKGISNIAYNHLNLPEAVTISNAEHNGTIAYLY
ncbi:hypothetical protein OAC51_09685, partial [Flavobacteriaceae bacterium]|nr:hypothetical protein [Flavobacteriaceae bacterium]